jgi:hypothetical protein
MSISSFALALSLQQQEEEQEQLRQQQQQEEEPRSHEGVGRVSNDGRPQQPQQHEAANNRRSYQYDSDPKTDARNDKHIKSSKRHSSDCIIS